MKSLRSSNRRNCARKHKYAEGASAMRALVDLKLSPNCNDPGRVAVYVCLACGWLHIGHKRKKEKT